MNASSDPVSTAVTKTTATKNDAQNTARRELAARTNLRMYSREKLHELQLKKLQQLLAAVVPHSKFYQKLYGVNSLAIESLKQWANLPTVTKSMLITNTDKNIAANHTFPPDEYARLHRTSGTTGSPMIVMDTTEDWKWWLSTWQYVWDAAQVTSSDTIFMAFSFGPFIGFWSAFEAVTMRGLKVVPGGGLTTAARLELIRTSGSTVLCCTPTYALHLASEGTKRGIEIRRLGIRKVIVAGEPGGSIPSVRERIEAAWDAQVIDHSGATEVGPWGCGTPDGRDLWVIEPEFIAEFAPLNCPPKPFYLGPDRDTVDPSKLKQLVLTSLGRTGAPALRYETGDVVLPDFTPQHGCGFVRLVGGILGRADDMLIIRGVNVFPSSIEKILHEFDSIQEFRITATRVGQMDHLTIEVEDETDDPDRIADRFSIRLGLRIQVTQLPAGTLPRWEGKAKRFIDLRHQKSI